MKKKTGVARAVPELAADELETMPTRALLARLQRLRWCEDRREWSDMTPEELASVRGILFKEDT